MKKILYILATLFIFTNCNVDDDKPALHYEVLPIESINLPQEFNLGQTYTIEFTYLRPTNCYAYDYIINQKENENRTLGVSTIVYEHDNCNVLDANNNIASANFEFKVVFNQIYQFHIWKGKDAQGNDIFDDYTIPVIN